MDKHNASIILRVFLRLQQQIDRAVYEARHADACTMCKVFGGAQYRCFGESCLSELEVR